VRERTRERGEGTERETMGERDRQRERVHFKSLLANKIAIWNECKALLLRKNCAVGTLLFLLSTYK